MYSNHATGLDILGHADHQGQIVSLLKEKIKRVYGLYQKGSLWARDYFMSTIGIDEYLIRRYVKH